MLDLTVKQKLVEFEVILKKKLSAKKLDINKVNSQLMETLYGMFDTEIRYQEENQQDELDYWKLFTVEEDKVKSLVKKARRRSFDRQLGLRNLMPELSLVFWVDVESL